MKKKLIVLLVAVAIIGGVWWLNQSTSKVSEDKLSNNTYSTGSTGIELVEFGDFQCSSCAQFYPIVKQIKEQYKDTVTFRFRHFPIQTIHPNARAAHRAAQSAAAQGKFWEMHDALYESQAEWSNLSNIESTFESIAGQLGLDMEQYKKDFASYEVNSIVNADANLGGKLKITGTPTFLLDGKVLELVDVNSVEKLSAILDAAIADKAGTPVAQ